MGTDFSELSGMTAKKALHTIAMKRNIFPNDGFMKSLIELDTALFHPGFVAQTTEAQITPDSKLESENEQKMEASTKDPETVKENEDCIPNKENNSSQEDGNLK